MTGHVSDKVSKSILAMAVNTLQVSITSALSSAGLFCEINNGADFQLNGKPDGICLIRPRPHYIDEVCPDPSRH